MIFTTETRDFMGVPDHAESQYEYLDRSARPEAKKVREFIEFWFYRYPETHRCELANRLRSPDNIHHKSAVFELVLFACLERLGFIVEVHPSLRNGSLKCPDFFVQTIRGESFYLEAVLASEYSAATIAEQKRKNIVFDAIEGIDSPHFFIEVYTAGGPNTPPSSKRLKRDLMNWLSGLDLDIVKAQVAEEKFDEMPKFEWNHDGWNIIFGVSPKHSRVLERGNPKRAIGIQRMAPRIVNSWEPIRDAIKFKGNRYGELEHPFIVAVNMDAISVSRIDEMQALFGQEQFVLPRDSYAAEVQMIRASNGAWFGPKGPQFKRVSGAWLFRSLDAWNIASREYTLYSNPWAQYSIPESLKACNHAEVVGDKMIWSSASALHELLGIGLYWPE